MPRLMWPSSVGRRVPPPESTWTRHWAQVPPPPQAEGRKIFSFDSALRTVPPTGTENYGGPVVTAGGLVFIAATPDERFRAFDKSTGELLWETKLPAAGYATPATYAAAGRQFIVVAAGGGKLGTPSGSRYVAYALPRQDPALVSRP